MFKNHYKCERQITIKQPTGKSRTVKEIELDFDFTETSISKTIVLLHLLYQERDHEHTFSIPVAGKEFPPHLQQFPPLFVIRLIPHYPKSPIYLLHQY